MGMIFPSEWINKSSVRTRDIRHYARDAKGDISGINSVIGCNAFNMQSKKFVRIFDRSLIDIF